MTTQPLSPRQREVMQQLDQNQGITAQELAEEENIARSTAAKHLLALEKKNIAEKEGETARKTQIKKYKKTQTAEEYKQKLQELKEIVQ